MSRTTRVTSPLVMFLAAAVLAACEGADRVSGSYDETLAARFSRSAGGAGGEPLRPARAQGRFGGGEEGGTIDVHGDVFFVDVEVPLAGGARAGRHTLYVPQRAVAQPTVFTMTGMEEDFAYVVLHAMSTRPNSSQEVGARGFRVPLTLCLDGTDAVDGEHKTVAYYPRGGVPVAQQPAADPEAELYRHRVCGEVRHFSGYIIAAN